MRIAIAGLALLLVARAAAGADTTDRRWYLGGDVLGSLTFLGDTSLQGSAGTVSDVKDDDFVAGLGGYVGRTFGAYRLEVEYTWRYRFDYNTDVDTGGGATTRLKNDVGTHVVMANVVRDFDLGRSWQPYVGAGLGWVANRSEVARTRLGSGVETTRSNTESGLAWALMTGVRWHLGERWTARLGYRFASLGEIDTGPYADGVRQKAGDHWANDFLLGMQYRF